MGTSQPEMRAMSLKNISRPLVLGILVSALTPINTWAQSLSASLDKYAYQLNSNVVIDLNNEIIDFDSNMVNCLQPNGQVPIDTSVFGLSTNGQVIGLKKVNYDVDQRVIQFTSETSDLICINGIFIDLIYMNGFDRFRLIRGY